MRTTEAQGIPEPLLPNKLNVSFASLVKLTRVKHLFCFFVSRTQKMSDAHGSFDILDIFPAMLRNCAVNGGTPVEVLDS
jgi:hypothetical protein